MSAIDPLIAELRTDPLKVGYATMDAEKVAVSLATVNRQNLSSRFASWRTMLAELGPTATATVKAKLEGAAASNPALKLAADMLATYAEGGGLDVGNATTRGVVDSLVAAGVFTKEEAAAIKALGATVVSRADELGLRDVTPGLVEEARRLMGA